MGCFSETWLRKGDSSKISEIKELGYLIRHVSRPGRGGGVAIAFKKTISITQKYNKSFKSFEHIECLLKSPTNENLRIICIYRPGTALNTNIANFCDDFNDYLNNLIQKNGKLLIVGDFNIHVEDKNHPDTIKFFSVLEQHKLKQHIEKPTHICNGTLDLVLTRDLVNERLDIDNIQVIKTSTTSDHFLIKFKCHFQHQKLTKRKIITGRKVHDINIDQFKSDILLSDLNKPDVFCDIDHAIDLYNQELSRLLDKHAPLFEMIITDNKPKWMNAQCKKARFHRRKLERIKDSQKTEESKKAYNIACKDAAMVINTARDSYYRKELSLCEKDKKKTYSIVNHLMDKSIYSSICPKNQDDSVTSEDMKNHFVNKVNDIYKEIEKEDPCRALTPSPNFEGNLLETFSPIDELELTETLSNLNKKECELDPIPVKLLMQCIPELGSILLFIVNSSLVTGKVPQALKEALVRPTAKDVNGDLDDYSNYRPISNLPLLSKIVEKCVQKQLCSHLDHHKLHAEFQSGYRSFHSCETATLSLYNDLLCLSDTKSKVILLLLDLSAAFDTVCHQKLLCKLRTKFGISGAALSWFQSYLSERSFSVKVNDSKSSRCFLVIGVPQGSILGPILFILYTKELESIAKKYGFSIHFYADDTQIYIEFSPLFDNFCDIESRIITCFEELKSWMSHSKLKLNPSKTKALVVKSRNNFDLNLNSLTSVKLSRSEMIDCSDTVKSLGVQFDEFLTFDSQINKVIQSCNISLRNLWAIGSKLSFDLKKQLVHCYLFSKLDYCNGLYYDLPDYQLKRLQKLQNSCVRFLFGRRIKKFDRVTPFLKEAHFLPIRYRIMFKVALMVYKCLNNIGPDYLKSYIHVKGQLNHSLRHEDDFFLLDSPPLPHLKRTLRGFSFSGPAVWNDLPYEIRSSNNMTSFKTNLKTHLFNIAFNGQCV